MRYIVGLHAALKEILDQLEEVKERAMATTEALNELRSAVAEQSTVINSNRVMLDRLLTMFEEAADDPTEIRQIVADVRSQSGVLSEDVARGTAAADEADSGEPV